MEPSLTSKLKKALGKTTIWPPWRTFEDGEGRQG
jgi:hypothetical protein